MTETLNVNVLVAAKEEYTKQLICTIQGGVYDIIKQIYIDSQKNNIRRLVSYSNFQKELKAVPNWTSFKLDEKLHAINSKYPYLMDLITAIFVSHVKILACVRLKSDDKSVKIKVPNLNTFLHKILINCSECIYYIPDTIEDNKIKILEIINTSINETIANQIPIEYILNEYLSGAFNEPETKYPENNNVIEAPEEDEISEDEDDEDFKPESKEIPIIPISKPIHSKAVENMLSNNESVETLAPDKNILQENSIESINELKNIKPETDVTVNKQYDISDDESDDNESDDNESGDDEPENKENTLF